MQIKITELMSLERTSRDHLVEIPSSGQGQLQKVALCHVQLGFEISRDGYSTTPVSKLFHPWSTKSIVFFFP